MILQFLISFINKQTVTEKVTLHILTKYGDLQYILIMISLDDYWNRFLKEKNLPVSTPFGGELTFSSDEHNFAIIMALILSGRKTAQFSALPAYQIDFEPLPQKSTYYVLNNWNGEPVGVLKTTNVTVLPFEEVTWEMARKEGEDVCIEDWRDRYREFFTEDSAITGYDFTPSMPVVFEEFELVWQGR